MTTPAEAEAKLTFESVVNRATSALSSAVFGIDGDSAGTILPSDLRLAMCFAIAAIGVVIAASLDIIAGPGLDAVFYLPAILLVALIAGWQAGVASYIASVLTAWYLLTPARNELVYLDFFALAGAVTLGIAVIVRRLLVTMRQTEARLRRLAEASAGMVFTADNAGHIREVHAGASGLTGIDWNDFRGKPWRDFVHLDDLKTLPAGPQDGATSVLAELRLQNPGTNEWRWYRVRALPLTNVDGMVREWVGSLTDIHEARLVREQRELLVEELRHRMKNLVTVINALAQSSRAGAQADVEEFLKRFLGRLNALGTAADIVLASNRVSMEAGAVIRATLAAFGEPARFSIGGPELHLSEQTGGLLAMAVHELATNAIKYGALSVPEGSVSLVWTCKPVADGTRVVFEWTERGGPPAAKPNKQGFGTRVIGFVPQHEKAGDVKIDYRPEGLYCRIEFTKAQPSAASAATT